jgi:hypothetical protein
MPGLLNQVTESRIGPIVHRLRFPTPIGFASY